MYHPRYTRAYEKFNKAFREEWLSRGGKLRGRKIGLKHIAVLILIIVIIGAIYFMSGTASASVAEHTDAQGNDVYFAQWHVDNVEEGPERRDRNRH